MEKKEKTERHVCKYKVVNTGLCGQYWKAVALL